MFAGIVGAGLIGDRRSIVTATCFRHRRTLLVLSAGISLALTAGFAHAQTAPDAAMRAFTKATREYAELHRRLERQLPPLEMSSNPEVIDRAVRNLAAVIRDARPDMRQGDFFSDELGSRLRVRVADALAASGFTPAEVRATEHPTIDPFQAPLKVGQPFHWIYGSAMFPCVRKALPQLPPELQYRIVGSTLVLIDVHANLVLDLLPHILAETELRDGN